MTITSTIVSLALSSLSVFISTLSFTSSRPTLIFFNKNSEPSGIINLEINAIYDDEKGEKQTVSFGEGVLYHIQVFNPSPHDIAYFHMEFIDNNLKHRDVWTYKSFGWASNKPKIVHKDPIKGTWEIYIPEAPQGVFKAHSFTPLYAFFSTTEGPFPTKATFKFKYAVRSFPYLGAKHRYKTFSKTLDLANISTEMQSKQKLMKELKQPGQSSTKTQNTPSFKSRNSHKKR